MNQSKKCDDDFFTFVKSSIDFFSPKTLVNIYINNHFDFGIYFITKRRSQESSLPLSFFCKNLV